MHTVTTLQDDSGLAANSLAEENLLLHNKS